MQQLTQRQRQDAMTLSLMFSLTPPQALQLLANAHYDLDTAINTRVNHPYGQQLIPQQRPALYHNAIDVDNEVEEVQADGSSMNRRMRGRRDMFHQMGTNRLKTNQFKKKYIIRKQSKLISKPKNKRNTKRGKKEEGEQEESRMEEEVDVKGLLEKMIEGPVRISFKDDLADVFTQMLAGRRLVAIHSLPLSHSAQLPPTTIQFLRNLYTLPEYIQNLNKHFQNYLICPFTFDYNHYPFMTQLVPPPTTHKEEKQEKSEKTQQIRPMLIFLRLNQDSMQVQVFRRLELQEVFGKEEMEGRVKQVLERIKIDSHRQNYNEAIGIKPVTQAEKLKIQQDRMLREMQEKQYFQNQAAFVQAQQSEQPPKEEVVSGETLTQLRSKQRQALPLYTLESSPQAVQLKLRLPNSNSLQFVVPKTQKVQYLFQYVESEPNDIGLENDQNRKVDLMMPLERTGLRERKEEKIGDVFGEDAQMQTLIVKEL